MDLVFLSYRKIDYTNKAGRQVTGYSVWFAAPGNEYAGLVPFEVFVSSKSSLAGRVPGLKPLSTYKARVALSFGKFIVSDLL